MQPESPRPRPAERNEFADAVARMLERRQRSAPEFAPPRHDDVRIRDDLDDSEISRASFLRSLADATALRRALSIVPVAIIGYAIVWLLYLEPSQDVTAKTVGEAKPAIQAASPVELPPPVRPEVAKAKPAPAPAPAATPVAPAPPPAVAVAAPSRPLSKDEIKELQGKLGAIGFAVGPLDGVVGPQTQAALSRYAQSRGLAKPEATQETLLRLRSETQASQ